MVKYLIIFTLFLTGCATTPTTTVVHDTKTVYKSLPSELLKKTEVPKPISKEEYLKKDFIQKEIWLTDYTTTLLQSLDSCNRQIKAISDIDANNTKLYTQP
jgi:hypothetical protein